MLPRSGSNPESRIHREFSADNDTSRSITNTSRSIRNTSRGLTRRHFLEVTSRTAAGIAVAGIAALADVAMPDIAASARANALSIANTATVTLPKTRTWTPKAGEFHPSVKARATLFLESVGVWTGGGGTLIAAQRRASAAGFDPSLVERLPQLLGNSESAEVQIRDAQYGGILDSSASVLVVVDQWRLMPDGTIRTGGTTVDVRLVQGSPHWRIVEVRPAHPSLPAKHLDPSARRVLTESRIRLPYSARADVNAGSVHESVLKMLLKLSAIHLLDVSVIRSGHPLLVFGTSRPSDHPRGRAVDIWALDSRPLVVPSNHLLATSAMHFAVSNGAYNVGGPVVLRGPKYFSDHTHQDHIHLGFSR